jgi:hypothetical protein
MKKNLFFFLVAGMAFASCVSDETVGEQGVKEPAKLTFSSPLMQSNGGTRANYYGEIGDHMYSGSSTIYHYPKEEDFLIYAVQHEGEFAGWTSATPHEINGKVVKYDMNVDGWAPKTDGGGYYYWPAGKMSFAASSPADLECTGATRTYGADGVTIENFEVNADAEHHYDLLYSNRTLNQTAEKMKDAASYYSGIPIDFKHALSSVRFSIKNESEANVFLTSIKVYGVKYKGTFEEQLNEATNAQDPKWTVDDDKIASDAAYIGFQGSVQFQAAPLYVAQLAAEDTDAPGEDEKCNQLLLMPQTLTDDATVVVTYTVNGSARSKTAKLNAGIDVLGHPVPAWEPGVRYTYRLVYGKAAADQDRIYFAPGAAEWTDHEVIVVEL